MKKLQIFMLCSVLAIGFTDNLQASWFRKTEVETPESKPGETNSTIRNEPTTAQIAGERDAATRESAARDATAKEAAKYTNMIPKEGTAEGVNAASEQSKLVFGRNRSKAQNTANMQSGPAKQADILETSKASVSDAINATGKPVSAEAKTAITAEAVKSAKTWSDTWNESSFKQWIDSIVESVNRYISKFSGKATGINLTEDLTSENLVSTTIDATATKSSVNLSGNNSLNQALIERGDKLSHTATQAKALNQGASSFEKSTSTLLEQTKAQQSDLTFWNGYGLFKSSAPVAA